MYNCRFLDSPSLPKPLHIHDDPGYTVDALRGLHNGFAVALDECLAPDIPFVPGDRPNQFPVVHIGVRNDA